MPNFRSFVERMTQVQLQHIKHLQGPIPLVAAVVAFSSLPIFGCTSSVSVSALATTVGKAVTKLGTPEGVPFLSSIFHAFTRALNTACLRVRIYVKIPIQWRCTFDRRIGLWARTGDNDTYATPYAEAKYWRVAGRYRRRLYSGNSTIRTSSVPCSTASRDEPEIPLVTYYTPRLLPPYRDRGGGGGRTSRGTDIDARQARVSPRMFCKWHWMVFQDACHPTLAQAAVQMKHYSNSDLREIQRIARLLPDEQVFGSQGNSARKAKWSTKYHEMWQIWLENKGVDIVIVFE